MCPQSEHLTTHDATYLEFAMRLRLQRATRDKQLAAAVTQVGVVVI